MREVVVQILQTRDGAKAAMYCFWYGTTKVKFSLSVCLCVCLSVCRLVGLSVCLSVCVTI